MAKIVKTFIEGLIAQQEKWIEMLVEGSLLGVERELSDTLSGFYNVFIKNLLQQATDKLGSVLKEEAKALGAKKVKDKPWCVRVGTGKIIRLKAPYVETFTDESNWGTRSRYLLDNYWGIIGGASPDLCDKVGFCVAICPSFSLAHQVLSKFGVEGSVSTIERISKRLSNHCNETGEALLMLGEEETLANKRVIISLDGGRTRLRGEYSEEEEDGRKTYETYWAEPKLFVIDVLNEKGALSRYDLPIYGCRFKDTDLLNLLESYLTKLNIQDAKEIQLIGDGAAWIWNQVPTLLEKLGVPEEKIVQTIDFYHASSYVHDLVDAMPNEISPEEKNKHLKNFKTLLTEGQSDQIVEISKTIFPNPSKEVERYLNYLSKHKKRMQYNEYRRQNLFIGSGIVESAIRRIINLRFKNTSTFWKEENVEKLFFLREAALSGRWEGMIHRLSSTG